MIAKVGRAAAIAYAREGCDVAINYFPTEEPDAQEVIALIKADGRIAIAIPGDLRDEKILHGSRGARSAGTRRSRHRCKQCGTSAGKRIHTRCFVRRF